MSTSGEGPEDVARRTSDLVVSEAASMGGRGSVGACEGCCTVGTVMVLGLSARPAIGRSSRGPARKGRDGLGMDWIAAFSRSVADRGMSVDAKVDNDADDDDDDGGDDDDDDDTAEDGTDEVEERV